MFSVIVPVYKNALLVEYCLTLLIDRLPDNAELILVDDASGIETTQILRKFTRAKLIEHPCNKGVIAAYNTGSQVAKGEILVFINTDVFVSAEAFDELSRTFAEESNLGAVGHLLIYPQDYTIQHAGIAFDQWVMSHLFVGCKLDEVKFKPVEERQAVTAAFFACSRKVFNEVGGFSEIYKDGMDDIEFCLRCRELGYRNVLLTRFPSLHLESATRGPTKHIRRTYNYSIFFSRWAGRFEVDLYKYIAERTDLIVSAEIKSEYPMPILNFCSTPNWRNLTKALFADKFSPSTFHDLSGSFAESDFIDLFRVVPMAMHRIPTPIAIVTDHFRQIENNQFWFARRLANDIIIDRHANVLTSKYLGFGATYS